MGALYRYYQRDTSHCAHVWLCAETDHYSSSEGDKGWGCGYRNFQMLLSSLHRMEQYKLLPGIPSVTSCYSLGSLLIFLVTVPIIKFSLAVSVPSIPRVQALIEEAWAQGADPQGASNFNHRLQGTRAWIGATEIYAIFTSLSVKYVLKPRVYIHTLLLKSLGTCTFSAHQRLLKTCIKAFSIYILSSTALGVFHEHHSSTSQCFVQIQLCHHRDKLNNLKIIK